MENKAAMNQICKKVYETLKSLEIDYQVYDHPPIGSSGDAFYLPTFIEGGKCKNLFLRNSDGTNHYLIILECDSRLDLKILAKSLNEKRLCFASQDRLSRYLGVLAGCVSPFNLLNSNGKDVFIIVDQALLRYEKLSFHPNDNTASVVVSVKDFMKYLPWIGNRLRFVEF